MDSDIQLRRALDAVEHLTDPDPPWSEILDSARTLIGADAGTLIVFHNKRLANLQQIGIDSAAEREYIQHYHAEDILAEISMGVPEGSWMDSHELFTPAQLSKEPYYVDYMRKHRMGQICAFIIEEKQHRRAAISFQRESVQDNTRRQLESERIRTYTDALQKALARRHAMADGWLGSIEAVFGAFNEAISLATTLGAVLWASARARELFDRGDSLRLRNGLLWHSDAKIHQALYSALAKAAKSTDAVPLNVPAGWGECDALHVVQADPRVRLGNEPLIFIRARRQTIFRKVEIEPLCNAFSITKAEARVLASLIGGHSPSECAQAHGVSEQTVRKQIASLMQKMDCHRQVDLVRMGLLVQ